MRPPNACSLDVGPTNIIVKREISRSKGSTVYEIQLFEKTYVMKLYHDNGDPGYTKKGRDLNRFRCELNAYHNLHKFGVCDHGLVPTFHGYFDRIDPSAFKPPLEHFVHDKYQPSAILLEFLPNAEKLDCENYSEDLFRYAVDGIKKIHGAFVHHHDIYPRNMLVVSGNRIVWTDFDVSTTFSSMGPREKAYCQYETELVKSFGRKLEDDQRQGLPRNTKYY